MFDIHCVPPGEVPLPLLLEADPSESNVKTYLDGALCFLAKMQTEKIGACVLNHIAPETLELFNISVRPDMQKRGVGTALLRQVISTAKARGARRIELGTGTFGYQLAFYQRAGFRVQSVVRNHFIDHYDEPIFEMGIQLKDMLRLALEL